MIHTSTKNNKIKTRTALGVFCSIFATLSRFGPSGFFCANFFQTNKKTNTHTTQHISIWVHSHHRSTRVFAPCYNSVATLRQPVMGSTVVRHWSPATQQPAQFAKLDGTICLGRTTTKSARLARGHVHRKGRGASSQLSMFIYAFPPSSNFLNKKNMKSKIQNTEYFSLV